VSVTRQLIEEISKDPKLYDELVSKIAVGIATKDEVKMLVLNSIIKDVATKKDLKESVEELRNEMRKEIENLSVDAKFEAVNRRFDDINKVIDKRFDDVNKRIDDLNKRISDVNDGLNKRFDDINRRLDDINDRIDSLRNDMRMYFFGFLGGILSILVTIILTKLI
jgi:DNA repair ATPase RecN